MQKIISILLFVIFICDLFYICLSEDYKLCADKKCSGPISEGKTKLLYFAPNSYSTSFLGGESVKVFHKLKGSQNKLWGIEIKGRRGYVPSYLIKETKVIHNKTVEVPYNIPDDRFPIIPEEVDTENAIKTDIPVGATDEIPTPANVLSPHEVVDGTTIFMDSEDNIIPPTEKLLESSLTDKADFNSNTVYEISGIKTDNKEISSESIIETTTKEKLDLKSENDNRNIEANLQGIETQNLPSISEINNAKSKESGVDNSNIKENSIHNTNMANNSIESENNILEKKTESIIEDNNDKQVTVPLEFPTVTSEFDNNELKTVSELIVTPEITTSSNLDISKQDSDNEINSASSEMNNPLLNINYEGKSKEGSIKDTTTDGKAMNSNDNSEVNSDENLSTPTDDITLNIEGSSEVKSDKSVGISSVISKNSKVNVPNVIESVEYSSSIEVNTKRGSIEGVDDAGTIEVTTDNTTAYNSYKMEEIPEYKNEQLPVEPVTTDNTTAYNPFKLQDISENKNEHFPVESVTTDNTTAHNSYKEEEIVENKNEQPSVETVISSPELIDESILSNRQDSQHYNNPAENDPEIDNLVESLSSDRQHLPSAEVHASNSHKTFDSHQFPNTINILGQLNNDALSTNNINSITEKQLGNSQEDITTSDEHFYSKNFDTDSTINNDEVPNLASASSEDSIISENSIVNDVVQTQDTETNNEGSDVYLEQADFLTTVYEFFGIYQSKEPAAVIDTDSDFHKIKSRSIIGNEEINSKNEEFVCKNKNLDNIYSLQQFEIPESTYGIIIYLTITAITVLIFTLGYYYIEKLRQDGTLVKRINELEKALLNSNKEKNILRNELELSQGAEAPISLLEKLRDELEESNRLRIELEEQNVNLERELETATEAGLELNKMLGEYLSSQQSGNLVEESLEYLQKQLNDQQLTIAEMTVSANEKAKDFERNLSELNAAKEKIIELTSELNSLVVNFTKLQEDSYTRETQLNDQITILKTQLEKEINEKNQEIIDKNIELNQIRQLSKELQHNLNVKDNELLLLKENLKSEKGGENNVDSIIDNTHIRAELKEVNEEKELLTKQLEAEMERKQSLENQLTEIISEKDNLHTQLQNVEKEKIETQTRLEVLSAYFKEKETQLQKELAKHEELWLQNQGQANSTVERIKLLQEEIQNYKSQNETLKNEIVDQEVSLKSQISVMEKKNHENWLLLRQTERRLEESKHESSQLRNRLTIVEKNLSSEDKSQFRVVSPPLNGDISTSPLHMIEPPVSSPLLFPHRENMPTTPPINFMGLPPPPPPPGALPFMPPPPPGVPFMPPPPTLFPGDRRPPPLGRMSSPPPPPPNTFSPPRTFSPYDQDRDSPPIRDRMYNLYDNDNNYRHRSPPPFAPLPPPPTDQAKDWDNRQSFRPIDQQRPTNRSKTNLNSNEFV